MTDVKEVVSKVRDAMVVRLSILVCETIADASLTRHSPAGRLAAMACDFRAVILCIPSFFSATGGPFITFVDGV